MIQENEPKTIEIAAEELSSQTLKKINSIHKTIDNFVENNKDPRSINILGRFLIFTHKIKNFIHERTDFVDKNKNTDKTYLYSIYLYSLKLYLDQLYEAVECTKEYFDDKKHLELYNLIELILKMKFINKNYLLEEYICKELILILYTESFVLVKETEKTCNYKSPQELKSLGINPNENDQCYWCMHEIYVAAKNLKDKLEGNYAWQKEIEGMWDILNEKLKTTVIKCKNSKNIDINKMLKKISFCCELDSLNIQLSAIEIAGQKLYEEFINR